MTIEDTLLTPYHATDRRVYWGANCSDMQREADHVKALVKRMRDLDPTTNCIYFPLEARFLVFTNTNLLKFPHLEGPPRELTGNFHDCIQLAVIEAIQFLESSQVPPGSV
jgi:hypothetical protein